MTHALTRTSPKGKGHAFIGRCIKCGQENLGSGAALQPCPMDQRVTDADADTLIEKLPVDSLYWAMLDDGIVLTGPVAEISDTTASEDEFTIIPDPVVYLRDLDGTGSMHVCSKGDDGAIAYVSSELVGPEMRGVIENLVYLFEQLDKGEWQDKVLHPVKNNLSMHLLKLRLTDLRQFHRDHLS